MKTSQNIHPPCTDEISIACIIHLFKSHKKILLICVIIGTLLGGLYGIYTKPLYTGSVLISPAKIAGNFVYNPKVTLTNLNFNSFYSKETFLNCNAQSSEAENMNYNISNLVQFSVTKDGDLIKLQMQNKNKTLIENCLASIGEDILSSQNINASQIVQSKIDTLKDLEEKLKGIKELKDKLNNKKKNNEHFSSDLFYSNLILSNDILETKSEINKIKIDLSSGQTKVSYRVLPFDLQKKSFPTPKLGALIGLFLGLCLGILITLIKQMKI